MDKQNTKTEEQLAQEKAAAEKAAAEKAAAEKAKHEAAIAKSEKVPVLKKTKDNYVPPVGEEADYHAVIEKRNFDQKTGKRLSSPKVDKFAPKAFAIFEQNSVNLGYHVTILHDPTGKYPLAGIDKFEADLEKAKKAKK